MTKDLDGFAMGVPVIEEDPGDEILTPEQAKLLRGWWLAVGTVAFVSILAGTLGAIAPLFVGRGQ